MEGWEGDTDIPLVHTEVTLETCRLVIKLDNGAASVWDGLYAGGVDVSDDFAGHTQQCLILHQSVLFTPGDSLALRGRGTWDSGGRGTSLARRH